MKIVATGLLIMSALAASAFAPKADAEEVAPAYTLSGQVSAVYRIAGTDADTVQVIRSEFGDALPGDASAPGRAEARLRLAGAEAVRVAIASGAVEGRADSIAIVYRLGPDAAAPTGAPFAPVAVFHCETRFAVDAAGAAHVAQSIRVAPLAAWTREDDQAAPAAPLPRFLERLPETSPDYVPQPLPER